MKAKVITYETFSKPANKHDKWENIVWYDIMSEKETTDYQFE